MQQQCAAFGRLSVLLRASSSASGCRAFATQAAPAPQEGHKYDTYSVPAGHQNSDLDSIACNISLNRRRDLTLRRDLHVVEDGTKASLAEVMQVRTCMCRACNACATCCADMMSVRLIVI